MKKKNLLLSSLALLVVAVVGFAGATYAWFLTSVEPSITDLDVKVVDIGDVVIAAKKNVSGRVGADFSPILDMSTIQNIGAVGYYWNPWDVTHDIDGTPGKEPLNAATLDKTGTADKAALIAAAEANADANDIPRLQFYNEKLENEDVHFVAFDVFFANRNTDGKTYKVAVDLDISDFWVKNEYTIVEGGNSKTYNMSVSQEQLKYSLRAAFVTYTDGTAGTIEKVFVYNPYTGITEHVANPGQGGGNQIATFEENYIPTGETTLITGFNGVTTGYELFNLEPCNDVYYEADAMDLNIKQLTIYVWIEGNDTDCISAVAGGFFSSVIQFATADATP